jgi:hypothetical protein
MVKLAFKFSGTVTPEQYKRAARPVEPLPYRMDVKLFDAIKIATDNKRSGVGEFMEEAVKKHLLDLDNILLAAMECRARVSQYGDRTSMVQVSAETGEMLQQASDFLKEHGFKRLGRGGAAVACALLLADERKILPSYAEEVAQLARDGKQVVPVNDPPKLTKPSTPLGKVIKKRR